MNWSLAKTVKKDQRRWQFKIILKIETYLYLDELVDHSAVGGDENVSLEAVVEDERTREQPHVDPFRVLTLLGVSHLE